MLFIFRWQNIIDYCYVHDLIFNDLLPLLYGGNIWDIVQLFLKIHISQHVAASIIFVSDYCQPSILPHPIRYSI